MRNVVNFRLLALAFVVWPAAANAADKLIPLDVTGPRPTAELTIQNNPPVRVIFDSGAGGSVINTDYAKKIGLPNEGEVAVGSPGGQRWLPAYRTTLPAAKLGEADITGATARVVDLGLPLPGISGVMSPNIFSGALVRFELAKARVVVADKTPATIPPSQAHAYYGAHPLPSIEIDVAGVKTVAHLDTGSGRGLMLPLALAKQVKLKEPLKPTRSARAAGGEHPAFISRIDGVVTIGPLTLTDPTVVAVDGFPHANVGFSILKEMTLVLDPGEQRSWLLPKE